MPATFVVEPLQSGSIRFAHPNGSEAVVDRSRPMVFGALTVLAHEVDTISEPEEDRIAGLVCAALGWPPPDAAPAIGEPAPDRPPVLPAASRAAARFPAHVVLAERRLSALQQRAAIAVERELGIGRDGRLAWAGGVLGRTVATFRDCSLADLRALKAALDEETEGLLDVEEEEEERTDARHTLKAPWRWDGSDLWAEGRSYDDPEDRHLYLDVKAGEWASPEVKALIAASPDLLGACVNYARWLADPTAAHPGMEIRDAICKALGMEADEMEAYVRALPPLSDDDLDDEEEEECDPAEDADLARAEWDETFDAVAAEVCDPDHPRHDAPALFDRVEPETVADHDPATWTDAEMADAYDALADVARYNDPWGNPHPTRDRLEAICRERAGWLRAAPAAERAPLPLAALVLAAPLDALALGTSLLAVAVLLALWGLARFGPRLVDHVARRRRFRRALRDGDRLSLVIGPALPVHPLSPTARPRTMDEAIRADTEATLARWRAEFAAEEAEERDALTQAA